MKLQMMIAIILSNISACGIVLKMLEYKYPKFYDASLEMVMVYYFIIFEVINVRLLLYVLALSGATDESELYESLQFYALPLFVSTLAYYYIFVRHSHFWKQSYETLMQKEKGECRPCKSTNRGRNDKSTSLVNHDIILKSKIMQLIAIISTCLYVCYGSYLAFSQTSS